MVDIPEMFPTPRAWIEYAEGAPMSVTAEQLASINDMLANLPDLPTFEDPPPEGMNGHALWEEYQDLLDQREDNGGLEPDLRARLMALRGEIKLRLGRQTFDGAVYYTEQTVNDYDLTTPEWVVRDHEKHLVAVCYSQDVADRLIGAMCRKGGKA